MKAEKVLEKIYIHLSEKKQVEPCADFILRSDAETQFREIAAEVKENERLVNSYA